MAPLNPWAPPYIPAASLVPRAEEYYYSPPPPPLLLQYPYPPTMELCTFDHQQFTIVLHYFSPQVCSYLLPHPLRLMKQHLSLPDPCNGLWEQQKIPPVPVPVRIMGTEAEEVQPRISYTEGGGVVVEDEGEIKEGETPDPGLGDDDDDNRKILLNPKGSRGFRGFEFDGRKRRLFRRYRVRRTPFRLPAGEEYRFKEAAADGGETGSEKTTVMIKNLPNKFTKEQLLELLDEHCRLENQNLQGGDSSISEYDFLYLPMDFRSGSNLGYAFVNLTTARAARRLHRSLQRKDWASFQSSKVCEVTYARIQGLDDLMKHFKNSVFLCYNVNYLPVHFTPSRDGYCQTTQQYIGKHIPSSEGPSTA